MSGLTIFAQVKFTASAEKAVEVGENFRVEYTVNADASGFRAPSFSGFDVLSGPNMSTGSSISIVNGNMTQSVTTGYSYILRARKEGKYTLPAAQVTVSGKTYTSNAVGIEVVKGNAPSSDENNNTDANGNSSKLSSDDLFVDVSLSKTTVYQGEHVIATIKIYTKVGLVQFEDMKFPSYTGFWTQDIQSPTQINLQRENVNGKIYEVGLLKQSILFPQKTGKLTIDPYQVQLVVQEKAGRVRNFFGQLVDQYRNVSKSLKSSSKTITVLPLPGNQPDNFSGVVGRDMKLSATVDKNKLKTDEGISLTIKLSGNGNLNLINDLNLKFPPAFEPYKPKIKENINQTTGGSSGSKTFDYFLLAREAGKFKIPPVSFSYFDTESGTYKTLSSEEFNIEVEKGSGNSEIVTNEGAQNDVVALKNDIRYIKKGPGNLHKTGEIFAASNLFYSFYLLGLLIFALIVILKRKSIRENANAAKMRNKQAGKISKKRLQKANQYLQTKDKTAFYKELLSAVWGYLGDKLGLGAEQMTKDKIREVLTEKNIDSDSISKLTNLLDTAEYAQYGPVGEEGSPEKLYSEAGQMITDLENRI